MIIGCFFVSILMKFNKICCEFKSRGENEFQTWEHQTFVCWDDLWPLSGSLSLGVIRTASWRYLAQLVGQQVSQQQRVRGVSHQEPVFPHDLHFLDLITVVGLENHAGSCGQVLHDHLETTRGSMKKVELMEWKMTESWRRSFQKADENFGNGWECFIVYYFFTWILASYFSQSEHLVFYHRLLITVAGQQWLSAPGSGPRRSSQTYSCR